jgi:hypothetical protein
MIKDARLKKHKLGHYEVADKPAEKGLNNYERHASLDTSS